MPPPLDVNSAFPSLMAVQDTLATEELRTTEEQTRAPLKPASMQARPARQYRSVRRSWLTPLAAWSLRFAVRHSPDVCVRVLVVARPDAVSDQLHGPFLHEHGRRVDALDNEASLRVGFVQVLDELDRGLVTGVWTGASRSASTARSVKTHRERTPRARQMTATNSGPHNCELDTVA